MSSGQHFRARTSHRIPPVIEHGLLEDASFIDVFPGYIYIYVYVYIYICIKTFNLAWGFSSQLHLRTPEMSPHETTIELRVNDEAMNSWVTSSLAGALHKEKSIKNSIGSKCECPTYGSKYCVGFKGYHCCLNFQSPSISIGKLIYTISVI